MTIRNWGPLRDCMRTSVTEVDDRIDVLTALKIMKKVGVTSLIVKRRDEHEIYAYCFDFPFPVHVWNLSKKYKLCNLLHANRNCIRRTSGSTRY